MTLFLLGGLENIRLQRLHHHLPVLGDCKWWRGVVDGVVEGGWWMGWWMEDGVVERGGWRGDGVMWRMI